MKKIVGLLVLLCGLGFLAYSAAPELVRDTAQRGQWRPTFEWAADGAKCTRYTYVVSNCTVTAVRRTDRRDRRTLQYFTFASWGGQDVSFVQSTKDPDVVTLRQAAEGLVGRWAFLLAVVGGMAAFLVAGVSKMREPAAASSLTSN
ncbi:MAG TPA: hypothetical protein VF744_04590 [Beijerinckiaceae bacterium]|jgi:hypothetical protein